MASFSGIGDYTTSINKNVDIKFSALYELMNILMRRGSQFVPRTVVLSTSHHLASGDWN